MSKGKSRRGTMGLDSLFTFGKYGPPAREQLEDVIDDDPDYIRWLVENDIVDFDEEAMELITKKGIA